MNLVSISKLDHEHSVFRFQDEDTLFVRRKPMSRLRQQQQQNSEVPLVMTQGRRVRNSLQRLEQQQDEMFEL